MSNWKRLTFSTRLDLPEGADVPVVVDFNFHPGAAATVGEGGCIGQPAEEAEVDDIHVCRIGEEADIFPTLTLERRRDVDRQCIEYAYSGKVGV